MPAGPVSMQGDWARAAGTLARAAEDIRPANPSDRMHPPESSDPPTIHVIAPSGPVPADAMRAGLSVARRSRAYA